MLSKQQFEQLLLSYQQEKNPQALECLVESNMKLIYALTNRFHQKAEMKDDLVQVGVIGLIKAINHFDLSYQLQFSTYAVPLILGEMKKLIRDSSMLKVTRTLKDQAYAILKFSEVYQQHQGKMPTQEEIAKHLELSSADITEALLSSYAVSSLHESPLQDATVTLLDTVNDESHLSMQHHLALKMAMEQLSVREKQIIEHRYFIGSSQCELATLFHISQAQVSRIEKNALIKLHNLMS